MAIGIDDLYEEDDDIQTQSQDDQQSNQQDQTPHYSSNSSNDDDDDFMSDFLRSKGIDDPSRIKFEDENNNIIERNWNDLSREEQINILNTPLTQPEDNVESQLSEEEIALLNQIRSSNMTPSAFIQSIKGEQVVQEPTYAIDDLSDDEIYLLDLETRVGELSEDEAAQALNNAKQNEEFYKKQVEGIRKEYKEREDFKAQQDQMELEKQQQDAFNEYQRVVVNAIDNFNSVGNLDLSFDDSDKEELAEFMLSQDESGSNYLYKALQDPQTLVKAAWFILNGDEAFDNISEYFVNQIKLVSENQYKKGLEDGRKGVQSRPSVVINNRNTKSSRQQQTYSTIDDLDDED